MKWNNAAMTAPSGTQAVDRAAALLVDILSAPTALTFTQLQSRSGLAKSTLSRMLSSLQRQGLVHRTAGGALEPGVVLTQYAHTTRPMAGLIGMAARHLQELSESSGETINLAVMVGNEVEQVDQVDCRYLMGVMGSVNWVGQRVPLHCSAVGKVFLAYGAQLPTGRLERRTSKSLANRTELQCDLAGVRERGWALADSELEEGLVAVAAPVFAPDGRVIAALSISGPSTRMTPVRTEQLGHIVRAQAQSLSAELGYECSTAPNTPNATTDRRAGAA